MESNYVKGLKTNEEATKFGDIKKVQNQKRISKDQKKREKKSKPTDEVFKFGALTYYLKVFCAQV